MSKIDYSWLDDFLAKLPEEIKYRKNIFEIAGFPHRELVISNFLSFYFDKSEDHQFDSLFFDSLIELVNAKTENDCCQFLKEDVSEFYIEREYENIDILISSEELIEQNELEWSIIIENKINARLYNDLKKYWNSVNAKNKIGIALTLSELTKDEKIKLRKLKNNGMYYIHIFHSELIEKVLLNLPNVFIDSDDRHLLFLKEYYINISNLYKVNKFDPNMENSLKEYQENYSKIKVINKLESDLRRFVSKALFSAFNKYGFEPRNHKDSSKTKQLFPDESYFDSNNLIYPAEFRIWISTDNLLYNNCLTGFFELYSIHTQHGSRLKAALQKINLPQGVSIGKGGRDKGAYNHIFAINYDLNLLQNQQNKSLTERLEFVLENILFDKNKKKNLVQIACEELGKI